MKKIFSTLFFGIFLLLVNPKFLTAQSIQWIHDAGSPSFSAIENGTAVDADASENAYVIGHLSIDSYFSGLFVPANQDGFLAKYNGAGIVQWVRTFGGIGSIDIQESAVKVSVADNSVYVCGAFRTQNFNPTVTFDTISYTYAGNSRHGFLAKYDLNGNIQWMKHGGGIGVGASFNDIDIDDQGRVVVVGTVDGTNLFDTLSLNYNGGILLRYLPDGTRTDLIQLNDVSATHQEAREIEVASGSGNIYVGGAFFDNITLNGFTANASVFNVFELKLDSNLTCQWLSSGGGTNGTWINGLAIDSNENTYITGHASGDTVQFGSQYFNGYTMFDNEIITLKVNASGTPLWLRHGGSSVNDEALDIIADKNGNTIITGFLGGNVLTANFDTVQVAIYTQSTHCFLARYDPNGTIVYARVMGGGSDDAGSGLTLANDSTFYFTGTAKSSAPWDVIVYNPCCLDPNFIVAKFHDTFNSISTGINEFSTLNISSFPNPFQSTITLEFTITVAKNISLSVYDVTGRSLKNIPTQILQKGKNRITVDLSDLNNGIYFCQLTSNNEIQTVTLVKQ